MAMVLAVLVCAGAVLAASPGARSAIGGLLGIGSVQVDRSVPTAPSRALDLGVEVTLAQARRRAGFAPALPPDGLLGAPRVGFDGKAAPGGAIVLSWDDPPASLSDGGQITLMQMRASSAFTLDRRGEGPA